MWTNIKIPAVLRPFFEIEIKKSEQAFFKGYYRESWRHLERAHILGQPYMIEHTAAHWKMLRQAVKMKQPKEVIGQLPRLLVGGVKSFVGQIPVGNTGGADVPPLRPMEIPEDLAEIIKTYGK